MAQRPRSPRSSSHRPRQPVRGVDRLWGKLTDLFAARDAHTLATTVVLAPRRLEPRRMLDAGAAGLALDVLQGSEFVQTGQDAATLNDSASDAPAFAAASESSLPGEPYALMANTPPSNLLSATISPVDEGGVVTLELVFDDPDVGDTHTVEIDWGDGTPLEVFNVSPGAREFDTTHKFLDDPAGVGTEELTIHYRVIDSAGDDDAGLATATVHNLAPKNLVIDPPAAINENGVGQLHLTFDDDGVLDSHNVEVDWGDGSPLATFNVAAGVNELSATHKYLDDNAADLYTINVRVVDDDRGEVTGSQTITVSNVAPEPFLVTPPAIDENGFGSLLVVWNDPGTLDSHTVEIDWGDGSAVQFVPVVAGQSAVTAIHQYLDDNPTGTPTDTYTIKVRLHDDDGGVSTQKEVGISVSNLAPKNLVIDPPPAINENDVGQLHLTFEDDGSLDSHTVEVDWGDGSPLATFNLAAGLNELSATHKYLDDNAADLYTINVRVVDDDGGEVTGSRTISVSNVAPEAFLVTPPGIDENGIGSLLVVWSDPGTLDSHTVEIDWGDGSAVQLVPVAAGQSAVTVIHQYLDDNPTGTPTDNYTIKGRVHDDDGGISVPKEVAISVSNLAPSNVQIAPVATIDENQLATLNVTFDDPGSLDVHQVEVNWGDGSAVEILSVAAGARSFSATHKYLDDNPTATLQDNYTVTVRVLDDDGGVSAPASTAIVTVKNAAPTNVTVFPAANTVAEGTPLLFGFTFDDAGTQDTHTYEIDWGDGSLSTGVASGPAFSAVHIYADNGNYTIKATVTDDDGGVGVGTKSLVVTNVAPTLDVPTNQVVNEGSLLTLNDIGNFIDPGFRNLNNTQDPANGGETDETFTYTINWGDSTAVDAGAATVDSVGSPGSPTKGSFNGSHTYADNGTYTVTVTVVDDDLGSVSKTFTVTVNNVNPTLTGTGTTLAVNEGQSFTLTSLGVGLQDPGFDNPANQGNAANGGEFEETFTAVDVDWGDGKPVDVLGVTNRVSGSPGLNTTAQFTHPAHTYADNGTYTVTLRLADDDGGMVTRTLTIVVNNVAPTLTLTGQQFTLNEGQTLSIPGLGSFTDPGFDNADNAGNAANGGETAELFTYTIDWGDGTIETLQAPATRVSGSPGVLTVGTLADSHFYADNNLDNNNDNKYTITVTISDDDGGSHTQSFEVTVFNVNPTLNPLAATDVTSSGQTTLQLQFSDPGADSFEVLVDWGDKLDLPPDQRFVVETVHAGPTPKSFTLTHTYAGPPDPLHPAADIVISVKIRDDDFGTPGVLALGESNLQTVTIENPGVTDNLVRIDTSPKVPMLSFPERAVSTVVISSTQPTIDGDNEDEESGSAGEAKVTGERYLELVVINPDLSRGPSYRLPPEVLSNLSGLFKNLPDGHYQIYLVQAETEVRRLVIEVFVRDGRLIDPGDDSEGARDRPPTDNAAAPDAAQIESAIEKIETTPAPNTGGAIEMPTFGPGDDSPLAAPYPATVAALKHASTLASVSLALSAAGRSWRTQVDETLAKAQKEQRKALKSVGHWRGKKPR